MDELTLRILAIEARLNALKATLSADQLSVYTESVNEIKLKTQTRLANGDSESLKLIEQFFV